MRNPRKNLGFFSLVGSAKALTEAPFVKELFATYLVAIRVDGESLHDDGKSVVGPAQVG